MSFTELLAISTICRRFKTMSSDETLWEMQCKYHWGERWKAQDIYKDLVLGTTILWKISFKKKYLKEKGEERRKAFQIRLLRLLDPSYEDPDSSSSESFSTTQSNNDNNKNADYKECKFCGKRKLSEVNYQRNITYITVQECLHCHRIYDDEWT